MAGKRRGAVTQVQVAERVIREALSNGPMMAADVRALCDEAGCKRNAINSAAANLGIAYRKVGRFFEWSLPSDVDPTEYKTVDGIPTRMPVTVPDGELRDDTPFRLPPGRIGIIGDVHVPYHHVYTENGVLMGAYVDAITNLRDEGIDTLLINGDFMDFYALSFHEKDRSRRNLAWEIDCGRRMIAHLREWFGSTVRIIYREGNHEERWWRYIQSKADEFKEVDDFQFASVMRLHDHGIEWVDGRRTMQAGQLWVEHGHEFFGSGGVLPARNYLLKAMDNVLVNHVHRTSEFYYSRPHGSTIAGYSVGCLCDLNPWWFPRNNWTHGYAIVDIDPSGTFKVDNRIILSDRVAA